MFSLESQPGDSILLLITFLVSSPFCKGHHGCRRDHRGSGGTHVPDCVHMAPESRAGSQASLGGTKQVLMARGVPSSRAAWLRSDLSITRSMQAEVGVAILTRGTRLSLSLLFIDRCVPSMSVGLVNTFWALRSGRAGLETRLRQAPLPPLLSLTSLVSASGLIFPTSAHHHLRSCLCCSGYQWLGLQRTP